MTPVVLSEDKQWTWIHRELWFQPSQHLCAFVATLTYQTNDCIIALTTVYHLHSGIEGGKTDFLPKSNYPVSCTICAELTAVQSEICKKEKSDNTRLSIRSSTSYQQRAADRESETWGIEL